MTPTTRAVVLAAFVAFAVVAGLGIFLGFATAGSLVAAVVAGVLAGALIWGAARRAESFHDPDEPRPRRPRFPGPPDREDGTPPDDPDR